VWREMTLPNAETERGDRAENQKCRLNFFVSPPRSGHFHALKVIRHGRDGEANANAISVIRFMTARQRKQEKANRSVFVMCSAKVS
jgi:hypothetical protein